MKYIILASSIFYLLGLKFTSNIDLNAKFQTDSVQQKKEVIQYPKEIKEQLPLKKIQPAAKDSLTTSSSGSNKILAPYIVTRPN